MIRRPPRSTPYTTLFRSQDLKQQQSIKLDEIAMAMPQIAEAIQDGSMDEELSAAMSEQFDVSKKKSRSMLKELRKEGDRKSTRLNSVTQYLVCRLLLEKKKDYTYHLHSLYDLYFLLLLSKHQ